MMYSPRVSSLATVLFGLWCVVADARAATSSVALPTDATSTQGAAPAAAPRRRRGRRRLPYLTDAVTVIGNRRRRAKVPGSVHAVSDKQLKRFATDDIHRGLSEVPGVYVREEDGFGLRPNIGMRGANSERSAKVTLMEDGVLVAPGAYAAPAAYYFPLVSRLVGIEVLKGPAAVRFGPSTVGGAINLMSAPVPHDTRWLADLAVGSYGYGKAHLGYGDNTRHVGWWVEGAGLRSDGFKELDGGGPTGFTRWDVLAKLRLHTAPRSARSHALELRVDLSDELSHETYTGLATADFRANPWRRYRATARDEMRWGRLGLKATYEGDVYARWKLRLDVYHHDFDRTWGKLAGFTSGKPLATVLDNPTAPTNALLYGVLTGASNTTDPSEQLLFGTNARQFLSTGAQAEATGTAKTGTLAGHEIRHRMRVGVRLHRDEVDRLATQRSLSMIDGGLQNASVGEQTLRSVTGTSLATALWAQDTVNVGSLRASLGLRMEHVENRWRDHLNNDQDAATSYTAWVPGVGLLWTHKPGLSYLMGVSRGFSPVSPGQSSDVLPEQSWNFEAGLRWNSRDTRAELIGFFNDYDNLKGTCSFSAGCGVDNVGQEFNGGRAWIWGLEASAGVLARLGKGWRVPLSASYTLTRSAFQTAFTSSNPQWGKVAVGDELPYVPVHQLNLQGGVRWRRVDFALSGRFASAMRDQAGQGQGLMTDTTATLDAALSVNLGRWGRVSLNGRNLLDSAQIVSYRPFGARPGLRRQWTIGYRVGR